MITKPTWSAHECIDQTLEANFCIDNELFNPAFCLYLDTFCKIIHMLKGTTTAKHFDRTIMSISSYFSGNRQPTDLDSIESVIKRAFKSSLDELITIVIVCIDGITLLCTYDEDIAKHVEFVYITFVLLYEYIEKEDPLATYQRIIELFSSKPNRYFENCVDIDPKFKDQSEKDILFKELVQYSKSKNPEHTPIHERLLYYMECTKVIMSKLFKA